MSNSSLASPSVMEQLGDTLNSARGSSLFSFPSAGPHGLLATISSLWVFISYFPAVRDGAKLFVIGGALESARRILFVVWAYFVESFFITAEFEDRDDTFTWMMFWLSRQPGWNESRSIRVSTFKYGQSGIADQLPGEDDGKSSPQLRRMLHTPAHNKTQYMWYKGSWMSVTRFLTQGDMWNRNGDERLAITLFTRRISKFDELLLEAKRTYKKESEGRINIYVSDAYNEWTLTASRPKRPLSSVVLDKRVKEHLLTDAKEFMASERWYADRGIPWRRGYLLHGCPGSGKTSLIHSLAGELDLDIYVISLSKKNLDDSTLNELISKLPSRSLALMEDIDAAFFRGLTREGDAGGVPLMPGQPPGATPPSAENPGSPTTGVTLSGLLGAIDGVAAQEGRLLFATTNKYAALDPALVRPGRLDVHVRFDNAGRAQAAELFRCFFPPTAHDGQDGGKNRDDDSDEADSSEGCDKAEGKPWKKMVSGDGGDYPLSAGGKGGDMKLPPRVFTIDPGSNCPRLTRREVNHLARAFAERVPEGEFSMAAIQGLLMQYKTRPYLVVDEVEAWVAEERQKRAEREGKSVTVHEDSADQPSASDSKPASGDSMMTNEETAASIPCIWWPMGMI